MNSKSAFFIMFFVTIAAAKTNEAVKLIDGNVQINSKGEIQVTEPANMKGTYKINNAELKSLVTQHFEEDLDGVTLGFDYSLELKKNKSSQLDSIQEIQKSYSTATTPEQKMFLAQNIQYKSGTVQTITFCQNPAIEKKAESICLSFNEKFCEKVLHFTKQNAYSPTDDSDVTEEMLKETQNIVRSSAQSFDQDLLMTKKFLHQHLPNDLQTISINSDVTTFINPDTAKRATIFFWRYLDKCKYFSNDNNASTKGANPKGAK